MRNHEVTKVQPLLDDKGCLSEPGWARGCVWQYRRSGIRAPRMRIKEWDYYLVLHDGKDSGDRSFGAAFTLSDDGYVGLQSVSFLLPERSSPREHTSTILKLFPMGRMHMPSTPEEGTTAFSDRQLQLTFQKTGRKRQIYGRYADFWDGKDLDVDLELDCPQMDTMCIATPFDRPGRFYYNQKVNSMRAQGQLRLGSEVYTFHPETDFGTLDWGRGVWTYDNTWYWGNGNTDLDGHAFAFNIGYGFGDTKAATENILFYDGAASKLDDVEIRIPGDRALHDMESPRYLSPWEVHESSGRFEMTFTPIMDRSAKLDFRLIVSDQHQVFGTMTGYAVLDSGQKIGVRDMLCFIEKVHNRY